MSIRTITTNITIQQLFEDFENLAFTSTLVGQKAPLNDRKQKRRTLKPVYSVEENSVSSDGKELKPSKRSGTRIGSAPSPKSVSKTPTTASPSGTTVSETQPKLPITYDVALALYGNRLTPHERSEIMNYENIYYLGLGAAKVFLPKGATMDLFDDDNHYYQAVPRDHIAYRYEIVERPALGKGTFAQVLKAYDHQAKKSVAIKVVRNERIYLQQSREELRILQVLKKRDADHKSNLVHIMDFFMFRNHMCITFELLGLNLYQVLKKNGYRGIGANKILQAARCILRCLELLYKCRIVHCDIKPENIMLKYNGDFNSVKVGDFGSSCYEQQQIYHYIQSRYYRAPEVIMGLRYGPAIDMWSLGCVLGELSNGYPIFSGNDELDQLAVIEEVMGSAPDHMLAKAKSKIKTGISQYSNRKLPASKLFSTVVLGDDLFREFVTQLLEYDPQVRLSPIEAQEHQWVKVSGRKNRSSSSASSRNSSQSDSSNKSKTPK